MNSEYIEKEFQVKDIMERRTFNRNDGSSGSVQKIFNDGDLALTVWDKDDLLDDLAAGDKYAVTGIIKREETYKEKTFYVYHTGKFSVLTPLRTRMDKEKHYEGKVNKSLDVGKGLNPDLKSINVKLDKILKQLDLIELTVHNFKDMI